MRKIAVCRYCGMRWEIRWSYEKKECPKCKSADIEIKEEETDLYGYTTK